MRLRVVAAFAASVALSSCLLPRSRPPGAFDDSELRIYRFIADSLYLTKSGGHPVALAAQVLDTACGQADCPPLEQRWGLDSLWWDVQDHAAALAIRDALLARAGQSLSFGPQGVGDKQILALSSAETPHSPPDSAEWRWFRQRTGAVALLQFSPVGFSSDRRRALVVVHMICGPTCGHWLGAALERTNDGWRFGDILLISSSVPLARRPPG